MLPAFVCIGAQKTGTTWLYSQLVKHPGIFLPAIKELNFFYRDLPVSWYKAQFEKATPGQVCGDISPNYMVLPGVAERMTVLLPDARLICILREPIARAKSQYMMAVKLGNIPAGVTFIEAFRRNLQYIRERGQYLNLLERFTPHYPRGERLMTLLYDELSRDASNMLRKVCDFIGVTEDFKPANLGERVAASDAELELSSAETAELQAFYAPHILALERYLQCSLHNWRAK
jgi:hypothetical protein